MTPDEQIIHDAEDGYGGFSTLIYNLTPEDQFRVVMSARRDDYQIPNTPGQVAGDVQREADAYTLFSWVRALHDSSTVLTSSLFYHYNRADYDGASWDYPISTTAAALLDLLRRPGEPARELRSQRRWRRVVGVRSNATTSFSTSCSTTAAIRRSSSR